MNKSEFKHILSCKLNGLESNRLIEVLDYYDEMISDRIENGEEEAQVIAGFGDMDDLAKSIFSETAKIDNKMDDSLRQLDIKERVNSVRAKVADGRIYVEKSLDDQIHIIYNEVKYKQYEWTITNGELFFSNKTRTFGEAIIATFALVDVIHREPVHILLPESFSGDLVVETINGMITINSVSINSLIAKSSNGRLVVNSVTSKNDMTLKTLNGMLILNNISCGGKFDAQTKNGRVQCNNITSPSIKAHTMAGAILINDVRSSFVDLKTYTGKILLNIFGAMDEYNILTTSKVGVNLIQGIKYYSQSFKGSTQKSIKTSSLSGGVEINFI